MNSGGGWLQEPHALSISFSLLIFLGAAVGYYGVATSVSTKLLIFVAALAGFVFPDWFGCPQPMIF